jgi:hypothetical protein
MRSLLRDKALTMWQSYWDEAQKEFFKVETLQDYGAEENIQSSSYAEWLAGNKTKSLAMIDEQAGDWARQTRDKPIRKIRIHLVSEPYTTYLEWEIEYYKLSNIPLGDEEVYLVNYDDIPDLKIPGDFMIFDNQRVANNRYSPEGLMLGMDFYESDEDISDFLKIKKELLKHAKRLVI